ncbi:MAG: hypothetical protein NVS2B9_00590 [Myxococcales bacterium]
MLQVSGQSRLHRVFRSSGIRAGYPSLRPGSSERSAGTRSGDRCESPGSVLTWVSLKTLSNYANHIGKTPVDAAFAAQKWSKSGKAA